jgi:tetratricopeptide (TPR) repeat protein
MPTEENMIRSTQEINPVFTISQFDEVYLPSINRQTFEKVDSKTLYRAKMKDLLEKQQHLFIILGLDSGLLANYLLDTELPTGSKYLFVELDSVLELLGVDIPTSLAHKVQVMSLSEFKKMISTDNNEIYITKDAFSLRKSIGAEMAYQQDYLLLWAEVDKLVQHENFIQKIGFSQKLFVQRQLQNVAENVHPASLLRNQFSGQRCIVLGGGPSLDKHMDWLKSHQDNLVVFTVSRLSKQLIAKGITPHIVVSVDPQQMSMEVSKELLNLPQKTIFINSNHVTPGLIGQWRGKSAYLGTRYPWDTGAIAEENEENIDTWGPTVTNAAIHLAVEMGFGEILLCGVDFCYSSSGYSHTQGSIEAKIGPSLSTLGEWVETYTGKLAETPIQLLHAIDSLTEQAKQLSDCRIYNLSPDAAKIEGIPYRNIDSFKFTPHEHEPFDKLHQLIPDYSQDAHEQDLAICIKTVTANRQNLVTILKLAEEAIECNQTLRLAHENKQSSRGTIARVDMLKQRIETIEQTINDNYPKLARFIKFFGFREFSDFLNPASTDEWSQEQLFTMTESYYKAFTVNCESMIALLNDCEALLLAREAELRHPAPLEELEKFWINNLEPGRVHIWRDRIGALSELNDKEKQIISRLLQAFERAMSQDSVGITASAKRANSLTGVLPKLVLLYRHNNRAALAQTVGLLMPLMEQNKEAHRLYCLGQNYLHQLDGQPEAALCSLLQIPDEERTETEMREIIGLALSLQKLDLASELLGKILSYSDEYAPQYAQVLKLQRQWQPALNVYLDYLDKYPGDVPVWLKLGQFMIEIGERDAAITAFSHALQAEPDNRIATHYLEQLRAID